MVKSTPIYSRINADVCYIQVSPNAWIDLGVRKAKLATVEFSGLASCTGQKGTSYGYMSKNSYVGMLRYEGSTVPGMSGAAYVVANVVHGMHIGCTSDKNLGVSSLVLSKELSMLFQGESPNAREMRGFIAGAGRAQGWTSEDLSARFDNAFTSDFAWAGDVDVDYDQQLTWGENTSRQILDMTRRMTAEQKTMLSNIILSERLMEGQTNEPNVMPIPTETIFEQHRRIIVSRLDALELRVSRLETKPKREEQQQRPFTCPLKCFPPRKRSGLRRFPTRNAVFAHIISAHPTIDLSRVKIEADLVEQVVEPQVVEPRPSTSGVVGESAFPADNVVLDNSAFLGQGSRKNLMTMKRKPLESISYPLKKEKKPLLTQESQSSTADIQSQYVELLKKMDQLIAGLSLDTTQKSKV